jgi:hypothetical protein
MSLLKLAVWADCSIAGLLCDIQALLLSCLESSSSAWSFAEIEYQIFLRTNLNKSLYNDKRLRL